MLSCSTAIQKKTRCEGFMSEKLPSVVGEIIEITAKTALSAIPVGGALITGVWDSIKSNCAQGRLKEWQMLVESRLSKVDVTLEEIGNNENFTSAMFQATELAIKTSERAKREYLANAVLNSLSCPFEESVVMMFLSMVGKYTLWHLKILDFFQDPKKFSQVNRNNYCMGSPKTVLFDVYPELSYKEAYVDRIVKELYSDGLMNTENLNCTMTSSGMVASRVSDIGKDFIKFITE